MNELPPRSSDQTLPVLCHVLAFAGLTGIPFANVLAPLILWLCKRGVDPQVDEHGRESLNFQISMTIYGIVAALSIFLLVGLVLLPAVIIVNLVFIIIAAIEASKGKLYRYPLSIRFLPDPVR